MSTDKNCWYKNGKTLVKKVCKICGKNLTYKNINEICLECRKTNPICWTKEQKEKHSSIMKGRTGGYREGGGRSKGGYYKDQHFDSQYEIEIAKFLDEHNIEWIRNTKRMYFEWEGRRTYYIPDFYLPKQDAYLETKGYYWGDKREKTLKAVEFNNLRWIELMQRQEWWKDKHILLEKIKKFDLDGVE